jgi:hypothetical protein
MALRRAAWKYFGSQFEFIAEQLGNGTAAGSLEKLSRNIIYRFAVFVQIPL